VTCAEVSSDFRTWTIRIQPGIYFADDPAFKGRKRELVAEDYVYAWKRFFDPRNNSPSYSNFNEEGVIGVNALRDEALKSGKPFDYDHPVEGVRALDRYTIRVELVDPDYVLLGYMSHVAMSAVAYGPRAGSWADEVVRWTAAFPHAARRTLRGERALPELDALVGEGAAREVACARHMPGYIATRLAALLRERERAQGEEPAESDHVPSEDEGDDDKPPKWLH